MQSLATAYLLAAAAVSAYLIWLATQNLRLQRRLNELRPALGDDHSQANAA
jgi:hypothetical protein